TYKASRGTSESRFSQTRSLSVALLFGAISTASSDKACPQSLSKSGSPGTHRNTTSSSGGGENATMRPQTIFSSPSILRPLPTSTELISRLSNLSPTARSGRVGTAAVSLNDSRAPRRARTEALTASSACPSQDSRGSDTLRRHRVLPNTAGPQGVGEQ